MGKIVAGSFLAAETLYTFLGLGTRDSFTVQRHAGEQARLPRIPKDALLYRQRHRHGPAVPSNSKTFHS
jgi:hypothetical protein